MRRSTRHYLFLSCSAVLLALMLAGCGRPPATSSAEDEGVEVLATVGGQTVTEADFRRAWQLRPPAADTPEARQQVLDGLIARAAQVDAARRAGLEHDPEIATEINRLLIAGLHQKQLQPQLESLRVSEEALQAHYEQHRQTRYAQPAQVQVAVLWFETRGQAPLAARYRPRLEAARAQVLADPAAFPVAQGFGRMAVTNSEHRVSRYRGGDLGWLTADDTGRSAGGWNSEVQKIAQTLNAPGDLSGVAEAPEGLFLVRLIARRPGGIADYASVRGRIENDLLRERRQQIEVNFQRGILAEAPVQRHLDALAGLGGLKSNNLAAQSPGLNVPAPPGTP